MAEKRSIFEEVGTETRTQGGAEGRRDRRRRARARGARSGSG